MATKTFSCESIAENYLNIAVRFGEPGTLRYRKTYFLAGDGINRVEFYVLKTHVEEVQRGQKNILPVAFRDVSTMKSKGVTLRPVSNKDTLESITNHLPKKSDHVPLSLAY